MVEPKSFLSGMYFAAVNAAAAENVVPLALPSPPKGRTIVVGAGKAAAAMARAVEEHWKGPLEGLVVTRYHHGLQTKFIEVVEAGHPVPDAVGYGVAQRILGMVGGLSVDDLVLCLMSGGASALMSLPANAVELKDKQAVTRALLASGATIAELNCVRKQLSRIKGGRLAAAAVPARVVTLIISDVPGDDPSIIGSGPTVADPTTPADALAVIKKYGLDVPASVARHLATAASVQKPRLPDNLENLIIATPQRSIEAAAAYARKAGVEPIVLSSAMEGEARDIGLAHAAIAHQVADYGQPIPAPCVVLSGGETSVTVRGKGRGGRNAEFALSLALALNGARGIHALAADTDGIDGTEDNAGAYVTPDSLARAAALGLDARTFQANNDAYSFFQGLGDLFTTGPTRTNVNDFRAIVIQGKT